MYGRRRLAVAGLLCALFACGTGRLAAQSAGPQFLRAMPPQPARGSATHYFGVMGEVPAPGVYEWPEADPLLVDVVRRAGGLAEAASGNIRIVRNGRGGQVAFYSPELDFRLAPGDVAIAEGAQHRARIIDARNPATAPPFRGTGVGPSHEAVQVAFVNLLDRPVVLKLRPHHANLAAVVSLLNQPPEVARSVRILESRPRIDQTVGVAGSEHLQPGSVLVFDRAALQTARIPNNLPQPTRFRDPRDEPSPGPPHATPPRELADVIGHGLATVSDADSRGVENAPLGGEPLNASLTPRANAAPRVSSPRTVARGENGPTVPGNDPPSTAGVETGSAGPSPRSHAVTAAVVVGALAILAAAAILWSMARAVPPTAPAAGAKRRTGRRSLEELIRGELEIHERSAALPEKLELFGRPTGHRKLRIDAAHPARPAADRDRATAAVGPHFHVQGNRAPARERAARPAASRELVGRALARAAAARRDEAAAAAPLPAPPAPHWQGERQPSDDVKIGLLDRVLSTVHGARRS
ncbi:MAG: hypothetical protein WD069_17280 [Planctomycetales bacterium]